MAEGDNRALTLLDAKDLVIGFRKPKDFLPADAVAVTQKAIRDNGHYTPEGTTYIEKSAVARLLGTDKTRANEFYADLPNADKMQNGRDRLVRTSALIAEIWRRIEDPHPALKVEILKYNEDCLQAFRDHPELERRRTVEEGKNIQEWPNAREKARAGVTNCEVSGSALEPNAHVHHIERRADKPRKTLDRSNLVVINPVPHALIHKAEAHTPEKLEALAKAEGWPWRMEGQAPTNQ